MNNNGFVYKGYYYDVKTSLFWISSRYYSPELCRFISPDDVEYLDPESVNGLNLYCYCLNNPISYSDPSGHFVIPYPAKILENIQTFVGKLFQDFVNFDFKNTSEQVVIDANYFSFYKGAPVIKHYIKNDAFTSCTIFGIMFINGDNSKLDRGADTIKHEWGHFVQEKYYSELLYLLYIAYPSLSNRNPKINYYSQPWEYGADVFGGVQGYPYYTSDASNNFIQYHNEIMETRRKILQWLRKII